MHSHVWIKCESVIMDVFTQRLDLAKVRHTHVRDNIHHLQASHMRIQHGKYYFLPPQRWVIAPATLSFAHRHCDVCKSLMGLSILETWPETRNKKPSILNLKFANLACATQWSYLADHYNHPQLCTLVCYSIASSILEWCCGLGNRLRVAHPVDNFGWSKRLTSRNVWIMEYWIHSPFGSSFGNELFV